MALTFDVNQNLQSLSNKFQYSKYAIPDDTDEVPKGVLSNFEPEQARQILRKDRLLFLGKKDQ